MNTDLMTQQTTALQASIIDRVKADTAKLTASTKPVMERFAASERDFPDKWQIVDSVDLALISRVQVPA